MMNKWTLVFAIYALMSAVTFVAYARDKHAAIKGQQRTPEKTLHWLEFLGGWPGGLLAMVTIRHKNRKVPYLAFFVCIVLLHIAGWYWVLRA